MVDSDGDGLDNAHETALILNPYDADSDDDGINDGDEVNTYNTMPNNPDSDGDGLPDGFELGLTNTDSSLGSNTPPGKNKYNQKWYEAIDNSATFQYRADINVSQYSQQNTFLVQNNPNWCSDPRNYDSDFDGILDKAELDQGGNPSLGLARLPDEQADVDPAFTEEKESYSGLPPVAKPYGNPDSTDYRLYLDLSESDDAPYWEALLPVSLGAPVGGNTETMRLITTEPGGSTNAHKASFIKPNNTSGDDVTVSASDGDKSGTRRWAQVNVQMKTADLHTGNFDVLLIPQSGPAIRYPVGRNFWSYSSEGIPDSVDQGQFASNGSSAHPRNQARFSGVIKATSSEDGLPDEVIGPESTEEGELITSQFCDYADRIEADLSMATDVMGFETLSWLITGVTIVIEMPFKGMMPTEYWLHFVDDWENDTLIWTSPEEFKPITTAIVTKKPDFTWVHSMAEATTAKYYWDRIYPTPFAYQFENVPIKVMRPVSSNRSANYGLTANARVGRFGASSSISLAERLMSVTLGGKQSLLYERLFNGALARGFIEGFPAGTKMLRYMKYWALNPHGGGALGTLPNGLDGLFIHPDGRIWVIECKSSNLPRLGKSGLDMVVTQTDGSSFLRTLSRTMERADAYEAIMKDVPVDHPLRHVMDMVKGLPGDLGKLDDAEIAKYYPGFLDQPVKRKAAIKKALTNWDPDEMAKVIKNVYGEAGLRKVRSFFRDSYHVMVASGIGKLPRYWNKVKTNVTKWAGGTKEAGWFTTVATHEGRYVEKLAKKMLQMIFHREKGI